MWLKGERDSLNLSAKLLRLAPITRNRISLINFPWVDRATGGNSSLCSLVNSPKMVVEGPSQTKATYLIELLCNRWKPPLQILNAPLRPGSILLAEEYTVWDMLSSLQSIHSPCLDRGYAFVSLRAVVFSNMSPSFFWKIPWKLPTLLQDTEPKGTSVVPPCTFPSRT